MIACTIAGSDSGGGAGIQADLKTFQELKVYGTSVITALTAQNTLGVHGVEPVKSSFVAHQLQVILDDFKLKAIKTGMLFDASIIEAVVNGLKNTTIPLIVDPVMIAKGGQSLLLQEAIYVMKTKLLPIATVCTPNIPEAEILANMKIETEQDIHNAAKIILNTGVRYVIMKGGHLSGAMATDILFHCEKKPLVIQTSRFETPHTHGTGCTFSAALTAQLAKGEALEEAFIEAKRFVDAAIKNPLQIGCGHGPTNHFAYQQLKKEQLVHVFQS
ncbi:MAG: bifunctional hydroxymethylpyrimidine kinase/phosphomethylpyrimidine kinase [Lysinibacillus sp.]